MNAISSLLIITALLPVASAQDTGIIREWKMARMEDAKAKEWLARWEKNIINDERNRYCDKSVGEDIAWLMTPFMDGFYSSMIDLVAIVDAYEHGLVFTRQDLDDLIATGKALHRPWSALVPYCPEFQAEFERTVKPDSWGGLAGAPFYLWCQNQLSAGGVK